MSVARAALAFVFVSTAAVAQQYVISTVAGGAPPPTPNAAVSASLVGPYGVAADGSGNIYFSSNHSVFRIDTSGIMTRIAGTGHPGYSGDGGSALAAQLNTPAGPAVDSSGAVFIADVGNNRIRRVTPNGSIATVVGGGTGNSIQNLSGPHGVAVDSIGNVYVADTGNNKVLRVAPDGTVTIFAGNGKAGYSGDGQQAVSAQLYWPIALALDGSGSLIVSDENNGRIRKVSADGTIVSITPQQITAVHGVCVDKRGNVYFVLGQGQVSKVAPDGTISTIAGTFNNAGYSGDGGQAAKAQLTYPADLSLDAAENLYIADWGGNRVRKVSTSGIITTIAGSSLIDFSADGPATSVQLGSPTAIVLDSANNIFTADPRNNVVRKISSDGTVVTVAGNTSSGYSGDGGPSSKAQVASPGALAVDTAGNLLIADYGNSRIRRIGSNGTITTIVGTGVSGYSGDGGQATSAQIYAPTGLAVDKAGNIYFTDNGNYRVRKVAANGLISTIAGVGISGFSGDGGSALKASLESPHALTVDSEGNVYIVDNCRVRRVSIDGTINTVVGSSGGCSGPGAVDGGKATDGVVSVWDVKVDSSGNLYLACDTNVRRVSSSGIISTIAGGFFYGYSGDGGPATNALLFGAYGVAYDGPTGRLYVAEAGNGVVRLLQPIGASASITSVASGASNLSGPISPGDIVVLYGSGIGPAQLTQAHVGDNGLFSTQLAGTSVSFNGIQAPIIYTWATQVAVVAPYGITGNTAQVTVTYQGQSSAAFSIQVASAAPSIFTSDGSGKGQAAAVNQDNSLNTAGTPAKVGDVIVLFATGEGQTTPGGVDGKPATIPLPKPNLPVAVSIGGQPAQLQYFGGAPGEIAGLMQINAVIPNGIQTGSAVPVVLTVGGAASQAGVSIAVR